jgi:tetratricopeptide (TPR) repeat protein
MSLRTYNTAKPDAPIPLPSTPSSWQSFSLPSEVLSFLSSLEDRNAISPYAFEKPKVTHELVWLMAEMMDEMCGLYGHALLVLEFLRVFAVAVWKKPEYLPVYQSWKGRVVARMGGSGDGLVLGFEGVTDPMLRLRIAKELVKRGAIIEAIAGLQGETDPMACAYLAHCYSLQGEVREALNWYHKALSVKDLAVMSEVLPALLKQLTAVKKFEEAKAIFLKTAEVLQNCGYNGELRTKELCARLYLVFAQVNLSESLSPYRRKDEAQRMKVAANQCFEQFIYIAQKIGCSLPVIQAYLDMEEVWVNSLVLNLRKSSTKKSLSKKADLIETLRSGLRLCHQSLHVFSQHSGPKGPVYMLALVLRRTAELGVLEEQLKRSMVQQPIIASGEDVVSRYIDDISRQIEETKEQWAEKPTRAEKALGKVLSAIQLVHSDSPLAKMMRADEVICCELVGGDNNIARAKTILPALVSSKELGLLSNTGLLQRLAEAGIRLESQQEDKVKYLNLYQYAAAKKHLFGVLAQAAPSTFKDKLLMNIYDSPSLFDLASLKPSPTTTLMEQRLSSSLAFKVLHLNPTWSDLKSLLSTGSAVLTVHMSPDLSRIYVGFVCVYKDKSMGWSFMDRNLELDDRTNLQEMTEQLDKMRLSLQRTPLNVPEDIERLMAQSEQMVIELKDRLDRLLSFARPTLSSLISPEQPFEPKPPEDPVPGAKKKPPPAPAGKKGAEEKMDAQLPVPNSGISTLVMCLDQRLAGLPFEALPWLGCVPIVTMDFSLANYWYRLSALGAKEDANSVFPLPKDSSKFLLEPSLEPLAAAKVREISEKLMKLKWESSPIASSGLWQRLCSKAGLFLHYLHLGLPDSDVSVLTSLGCCKLVIMVDKFTSLKRYIPSLPSPHAYAELFTLAGAACVVQNSWAIQPLEGGRFCEGLVDGMGAGQTVGQALFNWKNGSARMLGKAAFRTYGVPLLKL